MADAPSVSFAQDDASESVTISNLTIQECETLNGSHKRGTVAVNQREYHSGGEYPHQCDRSGYSTLNSEFSNPTEFQSLNADSRTGSERATLKLQLKLQFERVNCLVLFLLFTNLEQFNWIVSDMFHDHLLMSRSH